MTCEPSQTKIFIVSTASLLDNVDFSCVPTVRHGPTRHETEKLELHRERMFRPSDDSALLHHARINAYRDHWIPLTPSTPRGPPGTSAKRDGRAAAYPDLLTVPWLTRLGQTQPAASTPSLSSSSADKRSGFRIPTADVASWHTRPQPQNTAAHRAARCSGRRRGTAAVDLHPPAIRRAQTCNTAPRTAPQGVGPWRGSAGVHFQPIGA